MHHILMVVLACVLLIGCADQGVEPAPIPEIQARIGGSLMPTLVPGVIRVVFTIGTTAQEAELLVASHGLAFKFPPSGSPLNGPIVVPAGSEDSWIVQFKTSAIVKSASRIAVAIIS